MDVDTSPRPKPKPVPKSRAIPASVWAGLLAIPLILGGVGAVIGSPDAAVCFTVSLSALAIIAAMRDFAERLSGR